MSFDVIVELTDLPGDLLSRWEQALSVVVPHQEQPATESPRRSRWWPGRRRG
jgi:hypothetical protein